MREGQSFNDYVKQYHAEADRRRAMLSFETQKTAPLAPFGRRDARVFDARRGWVMQSTVIDGTALVGPGRAMREARAKRGMFPLASPAELVGAARRYYIEQYGPMTTDDAVDALLRLAWGSYSTLAEIRAFEYATLAERHCHGALTARGYRVAATYQRARQDAEECAWREQA